MTGSKAREEVEHDVGEAELDEHMETSREERESKVQMVGREHPFVVLAASVSKGGLSVKVEDGKLTRDIVTEKKYLHGHWILALSYAQCVSSKEAHQHPMRITLMMDLLSTL